MSYNAIDTNVGPPAPSASVENTSQLVDANTASGIRFVDVEIDREFSSWPVAEFNTRYADTVHAGRFGATLSYGGNAFMFDLGNVLRGMEIGAWAR